VTGLAALGRKSGRGKKIVRKSIEIYTTNKIMEKYPTICSFVWFVGVRVGVVTSVKKLAVLNLNLLAFIVPVISKFNGQTYRSGSKIYIRYMVGIDSLTLDNKPH